MPGYFWPSLETPPYGMGTGRGHFLSLSTGNGAITLEKSGFGAPICRGGGKHPIDMSASSIYPLFANLKLLKLFFSSALPFTCLLDWFQRDPASVSSSYFPFLFPKDFKDPPRDRIDRHRYPSTIARGGVARFVFSIAD